jgi:MSHA pilin protein MshC
MQHDDDMRDPSTNGFSLVELIVVIVIVAVLGAVALPRFFDNRVFAERGYYEELVAALKSAQKVAIATGCPVRFTLAVDAYEARQQQAAGGRCDPADASWGTPVILPDGSTLTSPAPAGVTAAPSLVVIFDALGRTNLGGNQAITVGPHTLTLQAASGYVDTP